METKEALRKRLNKTVAELIAVCRQLPDPDAVVYEGWTAKDILGHVTFWHESFARNVADLVHDGQPQPLKGQLARFAFGVTFYRKIGERECNFKTFTRLS
ncbi:hypothetical protein TFLX_01616 [Thermoflexales bacterium]|nr:hypothetical protein TFLX_01616 [Thermoflexales bacterium]